MPNCARDFAMKHDLRRHIMSVHDLRMCGILNKVYKCASEHCKKRDKLWPRLDNFKQHVLKMHKEESPNDLIERLVRLSIEYTNAKFSSSKFVVPCSRIPMAGPAPSQPPFITFDFSDSHRDGAERRLSDFSEPEATSSPTAEC